MRNIKEAYWLEEFIIRKEMGGYYPEDPLKADFFSGLISIQNNKISTQNKYAHLQYLIQKNK